MRRDVVIRSPHMAAADGEAVPVRRADGIQERAFAVHYCDGPTALGALIWGGAVKPDGNGIYWVPAPAERGAPITVVLR